MSDNESNVVEKTIEPVVSELVRYTHSSFPDGLLDAVLEDGALVISESTIAGARTTRIPLEHLDQYFELIEHVRSDLNDQERPRRSVARFGQRHALLRG